MRKVFLLVVVVLAAAYILFSLTELENILAALRRSSPLYLLAAVAVEILLLVNSAATFNALYKLVGLRENHRDLFIMVTAANFVNIVTPTAGVVVLMDRARQRGFALGRVTVSGVLYVLYEYTSLFVVLAAGFGVLAQLGQLHRVELFAAGFLLLLATSIGFGLLLGFRSPRRLGSLLAWLARSTNRLLHPFRKKDYLNVDQAYTFSAEIAEGLAAVQANGRQMALPLLLTLTNKLLLILVLALAFRTMDVPAEGEIVVAGFSVAHLFFYASVTPSGVGFVDSILPVALNTMGIPFTQAVLVALVYRAVTFWLPLVLGGLAFRHLQRSTATPLLPETNP